MTHMDHVTWTIVYLAVEWLICIIMLVVVPFRRMPEAAKSWLLFVFFLPIPGLVLYLLIGRTRLPKSRQEIIDRLPSVLQSTVEQLASSPHIFHPHPSGDLDSIRRMAQHLSRLDVLGGSDLEIVSDYRQTLTRLAADIDTAEHHVHLLFYILRLDDWTEPIFQALERAVARGVLCRVMYDSYGSWGKVGPALIRLSKAGVQVEAALPVSVFRRKAARFDLRNHRKIAIIDGRIGWTGSLNLIAADFKPGIRYQELMVRATGPIVLQLQYIFTSDWYQEREEPLLGAGYFPDPEITGNSSAQVLPSGPDFPGEGVHRLLVEMIHQARRQVVITTPYFVPDEALLVALTNAVLRGVKVILVLSRKLDQVLVHLAQKSYYAELLKAGVTIYRYRPAFLHAKHMTVDDSLALIGSSNMDIRSFKLNAEVSLICYSPEMVSALQAEQAAYLQQSDELTKEEWAKRTFGARFAEVMARLVSPLL